MPRRISTTTKSRSFKWAYLLDEDHIRQLDRMLKEEVLSEAEPSPIYEDEPKELTYIVYFSDGSNLRTYSVDEVLDQPNSRDRKITGITVSEPFWLNDFRAQVSFRQYRSISGVEYEVSGEARKALHLADRLDQQLLATRQWYSPFVRFSFTAAALVITVLIFLAAYVNNAVNPSDSDSSDVPLVIAVGVLLFFPGLFGLAVLLDWFRNKLFPVATFAIGQGIARNKTLNFWRNFLGIIVGVGLILSVVGGVIVELLV